VREWYEAAFGRDYLALYPHRDEQEAEEDVAAIIGLIEPRRDLPLLDLACGAGRHLIALCRAGYRDLVGLDLSADLLAVARSRIEEEGCRGVRLIRADMREIPFSEHFGTVLSLFTSFGYFKADEDDAKVLDAVHAALLPGGVFLLDTLAPERTRAGLVRYEERKFGENTAIITRWISPDGERVEKGIRMILPDGNERVYCESVRLYTAERLTGLFRTAGFATVEAYGSLAGRPYDDAAERLVVVGRKKG